MGPRALRVSVIVVLLAVLLGVRGSLFRPGAAADAARVHAVRIHAVGTLSPQARAAIVGGRPASPGAFPSLAEVVDRLGREGVVCTGTVVAPELVLTAGHCVTAPRSEAEPDPVGFFVITGTNDLRSPRAQVSRVSEVLVYPGFKRESFTNDAALLVLASPTTVPAVTLATRPPAVGAKVKLLGWGSTGAERNPPVLHWGQSTVQPSDPCRRWSVFDPSEELCVLDPSARSVICAGDSGSPLLAQSRRRSIDLGIASYRPASGVCSPSEPTVFTRTDILSAWVHEVSAALAPLTEPQPPPSATAPEAGAYVTLKSDLHRIRLRIAADGRHLVQITAQLRVPCSNGNGYDLNFPVLLHKPLMFSSNALRATLLMPHTSSWGRATLTIDLTSERRDLLQGYLSVRLKSDHPRVGSCKLSDVRFLAVHTATRPAASNHP